jgi:hypothetical protein
VRRKIANALAFGLATLLLAGCVDSAAPILTDSRPVLGERLQLKLYSLKDGRIADDGEAAVFNWDGQRYAHVSGALNDYAAFTVHPFENGLYIVQTIPVDRARSIEYALMRPIPLVQGAYVVVVIDEEDADAATRKANCAPSSQFACRVSTREQLFTLARATAAHPRNHAGLAINAVGEDAMPNEKK